MNEQSKQSKMPIPWGITVPECPVKRHKNSFHKKLYQKFEGTKRWSLTSQIWLTDGKKCIKWCSSVCGLNGSSAETSMFPVFTDTTAAFSEVPCSDSNCLRLLQKTTRLCHRSIIYAWNICTRHLIKADHRRTTLTTQAALWVTF